MPNLLRTFVMNKTLIFHILLYINDMIILIFSSLSIAEYIALFENDEPTNLTNTEEITFGLGAPSTLGGRGGQITRSGVQNQTSLANMVKPHMY